MASIEPSEFSSAPLPARADVVVIGGGIVGVSAAFYPDRRSEAVPLRARGATIEAKR